jgi:hypothetical protein
MTHLYVISYDGVENSPYKIGRSKNINKRVEAMESSHIIKLRVDVVFADKGYLERIIHERLAPFRVEGFRSREWFRAPISTILATIATVLDIQLNHLGDTK